MKPVNPLLAKLRHHVTGAIERGEAEAIVGVDANSVKPREFPTLEEAQAHFRDWTLTVLSGRAKAAAKRKTKWLMSSKDGMPTVVLGLETEPRYVIGFRIGQNGQPFAYELA